MTQRDDFEHRLGQGLKRWAQEGKPTLDLEVYVREKTEGGGLAAVPPPRKAPRRWVRWLGSVAAAAALMFTVGLTFPAWAGAAAGWPLVGPVVKEIIMRDAGLQWAYENGLIQETVAEITDGDITVRILGVMADSIRTTVIYQITGYTIDEASDKPIRTELMPARPSHVPPSVSISKVNDQHRVSWSNGQKRTPIGILGTASTGPLDGDFGRVSVTARIGDRTLSTEFTVTRTAEFAREVPVGLSQTHDGLTITVDSVIYTPAETMITYRVVKEPFYGGISYSNEGWIPYIATKGGKELRSVQSSGSWSEPDVLTTRAVYPAVSGPARLVIPMEVRTEAAALVWPLAEGSSQTLEGAEISLALWQRSGDHLGVEWRFVLQGNIMSFGRFEAVDERGNTLPLRETGSSFGGGFLMVNGEVPAEFKPVAIRATQIATRVDGPWVFDLPWE